MKYADRQGNYWEEASFQDKFLEKLYGCAAGRILVNILIQSPISKLGGLFLDTSVSRLLIPGFVSRHQLCSEQWEKQCFSSYNDFFTRKLKEGERPIPKSEYLLISPCDGKLSVYPISEKGRFKIKHTGYTLVHLLRNQKLAKRFQNGSIFIFRLTVDDYHRYCYVADGVKSSNYRIPGVLHTVNPVANDQEPIYKENTREYCLLHTTQFGTVLMMEVGALMVGKIHNYHGAGKVKRGQEKGRFEFGGSTIILLTEPGKVQIDRDLLKNSRHGYETVVKSGEAIGRKL